MSEKTLIVWTDQKWNVLLEEDQVGQNGPGNRHDMALEGAGREREVGGSSPSPKESTEPDKGGSKAPRERRK